MSENVPAEAARPPVVPPPPPPAASEQETTTGRKKRGAERQITKDDADDDEDGKVEEEEVRENAFQRASADVLKKRRIIKATRPIPTAGGATATKPSSNPFARVQLQSSSTTTTSTTTTTTAAPKVFGATTSFAGFGTAKATTSGGFGSSSSSGFGTSSSSAGGFGATGSKSSGLSFGTAKGFGQVTAAAPSSSSSGGFGTSTNTGFSAVATSSGANKKRKLSTEKDFSKDNKDATDTPAADSPGGEEKDAATSSPSGSPNAASPAAATTTTLPPVAVLPKEYELKSGEEDETILLEVRCRTYKWVDKSISSKDDAEAAAANAAAREKVAAVPASESALGSIADKKKDEEEDTDAKAASDAATTATKNASTSSSSSSPSPSPGDWQEVGVGQLRVLRHEGLGRVRLVQRRQLTPTGLPTKVILNAPFWKESALPEIDQQGSSSAAAAPATNNVAEKYVKLFTMCEGKTVKLLFKFKLASEATELKTLLQAERLRAQSLNQQSSSASPTEATRTQHPSSSAADETTKSPAKEEEEEGKVVVDSSKEVGAKEEAAKGDKDVGKDSHQKSPAS